MPFSFDHYWPLLFLPSVPFLWWVGRRTATSLSGWHLSLSTASRSVLILLLAVALMRPTWYRGSSAVSVVYVLDVSRSISPAFIDSAIEWMAGVTVKGAPALARYIAFADRPAVVEEPQEIRSLPVLPEESGDVPLAALVQSSTNVEQALLEALHHFAPDKLRRLVLISDGNETRGDLRRALWRVQEQGVRVFTVPAEVRSEGDGWIEAIEIPGEVMAEEPVTAAVSIFSRRATTATVELRDTGRREDHRGQLLGRRRVQLEPGRNRVTFDVRLKEPGTAGLEASLSASGDPFPGNDRHLELIHIGERARVLYVEGRWESARYLREALASEGIEVTSTSAAGLPGRLDALQAYGAVILSDVPAGELSKSQMKALAAYVRDAGGGLLFAGGVTSFGESGYAETPVEELLPVRFQVQEKWKDLALVIVLDKSYSMKGEKLELAKEATKAALDLLEETHRFGVVTFDWEPHTAVPLQPVTDKPGMKQDISRIRASAQTNIYPALESSREQLTASDAKVKHVILLSDGKTYPDDYQGLLERMAEDDITVSTVAVGDEADRELLAAIAEWGDGRSYFIRDATRVQQIFMEETRIAVQATLVEEPFRPVVKRRVEAFQGIDFATAPPLRGYVSTRPKETAEVLLESETESPVLARWQYGLGKAVAFTSDVKNRWAVDWLAWEGYGKFWSQLVRESLRRHKTEELDFQVRRVGNEARATLSAVAEDGRFLNALRPEVQVTGPEGERILRLRQVAPGAYQASYPLRASGKKAYEFALVVSGIRGVSRRALRESGTRALVYAYPDEYRFYPTNVELLRSISDQTGGKFAPVAENIFADYGERVTAPTPLWPWLAGLALALYLFDIALRRAPWFWRRLDSRLDTAQSQGPQGSSNEPRQ